MNESKMISRSEATTSVGRIVSKSELIGRLSDPTLSFSLSDASKILFEKNSMSELRYHFLVPMKVCRDVAEFQDGRNYEKIASYIEEFKKIKEGKFKYFWLYMHNPNVGTSYCDMVGGSRSEIENLEKRKFVRNKLMERGRQECWILTAYRETLKEIFEISEMKEINEKIVKYLQKCRINVEMPFLVGGDEEACFGIGAELILLLIRVCFGISSRDALDWYHEGNILFAGGRDVEFGNFCEVVKQYPFQSYERFKKMEQLASIRHNSYAACEIGDVYRYGAILYGSNGRRIEVLKDDGKAEEFYGIAIRKNHSLAMSAVLGMGTLCNEEQREEYMEKALAVSNPIVVAHMLRKYISCLDTETENPQENQKLLCIILEGILDLDDILIEKYELEKQLLESEYFLSLSENEISEELRKEIGEVYKELTDIDFLKDVHIILRIKERIIQQEEEQFGLDESYELGCLLREEEPKKSADYFRKGYEAGNVKSALEYAKLNRRNRKTWMRILLTAAKKEEEQQTILEELTRDTSIFRINAEWEEGMLLEMYFLLLKGITLISGKVNAAEPGSRRQRYYNSMQNRISECKDAVEALLQREILKVNNAGYE